MFALLLSDAMDPFYRNISAFPTIVYTTLLVVCVIYWLGAVLGIVDLDVLDANVAEVELNTDSGSGSGDVLAGLLLRFGLAGVPVPVSITLVALIGWLLCYYIVHFVFPLVPYAPLRWLLGVPVLLATAALAALVTAVIIRPLRPLFRNANRETTQYLLGQVAVVRTSRVDETFGEANLADGGAGLIVKIRAADGNLFTRGDRVVLYERMADGTVFRVMSEEEFEGR